jgi:hypothetical protein
VLQVPVKSVSFYNGNNNLTKNQEDLSETGSEISPKEEAKQNFTKKIKMINFKKLDDDFEIPTDWKREKEMGKGAYGKVMECVYLPSN